MIFYYEALMPEWVALRLYRNIVSLICWQVLGTIKTCRKFKSIRVEMYMVSL